MRRGGGRGGRARRRHQRGRRVDRLAELREEDAAHLVPRREDDEGAAGGAVPARALERVSLQHHAHERRAAAAAAAVGAAVVVPKRGRAVGGRFEELALGGDERRGGEDAAEAEDEVARLRVGHRAADGVRRRRHPAEDRMLDVEKLHLVRERRNGTDNRYYGGGIQEGFGMLCAEAGIELRDWSRTYRSPYWNHKHVVDWSGATSNFTLPMARALFVPIQMVFGELKFAKSCCEPSEAACRGAQRACAVDLNLLWGARGSDCCASSTTRSMAS